MCYSLPLPLIPVVEHTLTPPCFFLFLASIQSSTSNRIRSGRTNMFMYRRAINRKVVEQLNVTIFGHKIASLKRINNDKQVVNGYDSMRCDTHSHTDTLVCNNLTFTAVAVCECVKRYVRALEYATSHKIVFGKKGKNRVDAKWTN